LDLTNQAAVEAFFKSEKPDQVYLAAAKVGGIHANNTYPAEFIYQNLMVQANVIHSAWLNGVRKLLFLGSSLDTLFEVVEQSMKFIVSHISVAFEFDGSVQRKERFAYPLAAVREA